MNFTSTIYKLSNVDLIFFIELYKKFKSAKMEYKIEADINKIEEYLKSIIIKQGIYDVAEIYPFYMIKDIENIINSLNAQYSLW